jgi:tetratricopeptide (TPR) repeat protein
MADDLKAGQAVAGRRRRHGAAKAEAKVEAIELALEALPADDRAASAHLLVQEQAGLIRSQRRSEDLGSGLKLLTGLVGLAAAAAVAVMVWQASNERGLVIEAFSVPPDMAAQGLTGQVLAGQLEDRLSQLQAKTDSARAQATYSNDWGHDIRVEIPQTGVSISELQRWLRQWLGHQTRVGGEVFRTPSGDLRLTVRAGGAAGDTAIGKPGDLDTLMQKGAEHLFERTQPYRYGVYLMQNGRVEDGRAVFDHLSRDGPVDERVWGYVGLGLAESTPQGQIAQLEKALTFDSDNALALFNLAQAYEQLGRSQRALEIGRRAAMALKRPDRGGMAAEPAAVSLPTLSAYLSERVGDYAGAARLQGLLGKLPNYYGSQLFAPVSQAADLARNHDPAGAERLLPPGRSDAQMTHDLQAYGRIVSARYEIARARGDWAGALSELDAALVELTRILGAGKPLPPDALGPLPDAARAELLARLGRFDEASALAAPLPRDCYDCLIARAEIADLQDRGPEADRWFGAAAAAGPGLAEAQTRWAVSLLRRGDGVGALKQAEAATASSPHFSDAWAARGEAQLRLGKAKEAARSLASAVELAPQWKRARLLLADALARSGQPAEAARQRAQSARLA